VCVRARAFMCLQLCLSRICVEPAKAFKTSVMTISDVAFAVSMIRLTKRQQQVYMSHRPRCTVQLLLQNPRQPVKYKLKLRQIEMSRSDIDHPITGKHALPFPQFISSLLCSGGCSMLDVSHRPDKTDNTKTSFTLWEGAPLQ
jgi:hypothetical protein